MSHIAARATAAAERVLPGGLDAAIDRMTIATDGRATSLTPAQLEVLTLLAFGVETVRDLCDARGFTSTNAIADHTARLETRGLIERLRPRDGTAYRYAPWLLTSAGWRTLGPCEHITRRIDSREVLIAGPLYLIAAVHTEPINYCPWCGWRLR